MWVALSLVVVGVGEDRLPLLDRLGTCVSGRGAPAGCSMFRPNEGGSRAPRSFVDVWGSEVSKSHQFDIEGGRTPSSASKHANSGLKLDIPSNLATILLEPTQGWRLSRGWRQTGPLRKIGPQGPQEKESLMGKRY